MSGEFTCAGCGQTFERLGTREDARNEARLRGWDQGAATSENVVSLCDRCYESFEAWVKSRGTS